MPGSLAAAASRLSALLKTPVRFVLTSRVLEGSFVSAMANFLNWLVSGSLLVAGGSLSPRGSEYKLDSMILLSVVALFI